MWLVGGTKTKTRPVKGGRTAQRYCEECKDVATFRECDVKDSFHLFFVDLLDTSARRMVCADCGEDHDVDAFFSALESAPSGRARLAADAPSSRRFPEGASRESARASTAAGPASARAARNELPPKPALARPDDPEIDDMLRALKSKIGKG